jgi:UDP-glucose:glycoprotein glucosyltransferase
MSYRPLNSTPADFLPRETAADENATSYFPLLDRIAEGHFAPASTERELYESFIKLLQDDGHMGDPQTLSSYQLALSLRSAAPRIEAHYQYYHTTVEPSIKVEEDTSCPTWVLLNGIKYCTPFLDEPHGKVKGNTLGSFGFETSYILV